MCLCKSQLQEVLHRGQHVKAECVRAVVHGDDHPGLEGVHNLLGLLGPHGVEAAHRHQDGVQVLELVHHIGGGHGADVPQVGHPQALGFQQVDGVGAPPQSSWKEGSAVMVKGFSGPSWRRATPAR